MKVLIATPAYGRQVTVDYLLAIRSLEASFLREGIASDLNLTIGASLPRSRNALASRVLHDESYTHLLFVDSDMSFRPEAVGKLVRSGKPFCGCICPSRQLDYGQIQAAARAIADPVVARNVGQTYICLEDVVLRQGPDGQALVAEGGLVRVERIGFGVTLVHRSVLARMRDTLPQLVLRGGRDGNYVAMGAPFDILQAFDALQEPHGGFLSEDLSFSRRWTEGCGGEIWACVDEEIGHVGEARFVGRAVDRLRHSGVKGA